MAENPVEFQVLTLEFLLILLKSKETKVALTGPSLKSFFQKTKANKADLSRDMERDRLIDFDRDIATVILTTAGRELLTISSAQNPLDEVDQKIMEKLGKSDGPTLPSAIKFTIRKVSLKVDERDRRLLALSDRGLVTLETKLKAKSAKVWLTDRGREVLDQLFQSFTHLRHGIPISIQTVPPVTEIGSKPTDEEILDLICTLDRDLGADNYLPIFHLRQKLQPPLSREEVDQALYRLQGTDQIELGTLQETHRYTPEQLQAGINQEFGNPLFFISLPEADDLFA